MPQAHSDNPLAPSNPSSDHGLVRGIGLWHATALNMIDMIGVGPFVTIPLMVATMHGPQAMAGWILGALLVVCDGLVWAELGAALPQAGGPVRYLRAMYGPRVGGWLAFLFVFQLTFSAPLSMASGCIGFAQYAEYLWPALHNTITAQRIPLSLPGIGTTYLEFTITNGTFLAMATVATAVVLLYRRITIIGRLGALLWIGVVGTTLAIIFSGLTHFEVSRAFTFPPGAWAPTHAFFTGLGAALLIAVYDYWGYYNVCYLGGEIHRSRTSHSPRHPAIDCRRRPALPDHEHLDPGCDAVAGRGKVTVHRVRLHGPYLGTENRRARHRDDALDGVRIGLFAAAWLFARPIRRRARGRLLQGLCARAPEASVPLTSRCSGSAERRRSSACSSSPMS